MMQRKVPKNSVGIYGGYLILVQRSCLQGIHIRSMMIPSLKDGGRLIYFNLLQAVN